VVVALDDGSTDDTKARLAADPMVRVLLTNPVRDSYRGWDDSANRRRLLHAAAVVEPRWIMFLDADERLERSDAAALRRFVSDEALPGFAYGFRVFRMVADTGTFDPSSLWLAYRLFAFEPGQHLPAQRLHFIPVPTSIPHRLWLPTTLRIQHLGGSTAERRAARFKKYEEADPERQFQADYSNLLSEPPDIVAWEPRPGSLSVLGDLDSPHDSQPGPESVDGPVLSAVIIAHNDEATIARTVSSVVGQDVPFPFEVIVVTSGHDRTADVVRKLFPQVALVQLAGDALPGQARNAGLRIATGEYVSFPGSHVELPAGSLAARIAAHDLGYAMVTGTTLNGNTTWAGTASYFLDNSAVLPGRPSTVLNGPPSHCSYRRDLLEAVGGFPEDRRTGEDTVVNHELWRRGHIAYRAQDVWLVHRSPCRTAGHLVRHHFARGRGSGRIYLETPRTQKRFLNRDFVKRMFVQYVPHRLQRTRADVEKWGGDDIIAIYRLVAPLVALGATAAWAGTWYEILRPSRGKLAELLAAPPGKRRRTDGESATHQSRRAGSSATQERSGS
jgi:glycosyltransferase involved in cell wall biosynthesis